MAEDGEERTRIRQLAAVVTTAAFVGLAAGLVEVVFQGIRHFIFHQFIWSSRHVGWMTPLSYLVFLGVAAAPGLGLALVRPRWPVVPAVAGLTGIIAGFGAFRMVTAQRLHVVALAALAIGVGVQLARVARANPGRWRRLTLRGSLAMAIAVLGWGLGSTGYWRWKERRAVGALPAATPGMPNVLLLVLDTVRWQNLTVYGYGRPTTPRLAAFAERGAVFERAISAAPWTLPSHATMFTGREPWEHLASFRVPLSPSDPTIAEVFRDHGYLTGGFSGNQIYANWQTGLDRGFDHYEDYPVSLRQILLSSEIGQLVSSQRGLAIRASDRTTARDVSGMFLRWLPAAGRRGRPFFAFMNFMDAHRPYQTPASQESRFRAGNLLVDRYDAALANLDEQLGELIDELDRRGVFENTVVVVTADHGEHLGDHRMDDHANSLYAQLLRVPLIVVYPKVVPAKLRVSGQVGLAAIGPTILELAGISDGPVRGPTLTGYLRGAAPAESPVVSQVDRHPRQRSWFRNAEGPLWGVYFDGLHLIENPGGGIEVYDAMQDPGDEHDLATDGSLLGRVKALQGVIDSARSGK